MTLIESRQPSTEREVEVIVPLEDRRQRIVATLESAGIRLNQLTAQDIRDTINTWKVKDA